MTLETPESAVRTEWVAAGSGFQCPQTTERGRHIMTHSKTWDDKVARGKRLVAEIGDRKWELGDLANEVCPAGANGAHDDRLRKFADEIGLNPATLNGYRSVAAAWRPSARAEGQTWTTHARLAGRDDRFEIIAEQTWTYNSLYERLGRLPNPSRVNRETGEIEESTPSPQVVREAIKSDPKIASAADQALEERHTEWKKQRPTPQHKPDTERDAYNDASALMIKLRAAHRALADAAMYAQNVRGLGADELRSSVMSEVEWIRGVCDVLEVGANGGPLDSQLQDLLDAEAGR